MNYYVLQSDVSMSVGFTLIYLSTSFYRKCLKGAALYTVAGIWLKTCLGVYQND